MSSPSLLEKFVTSKDDSLSKINYLVFLVTVGNRLCIICMYVMEIFVILLVHFQINIKSVEYIKKFRK